MDKFVKKWQSKSSVLAMARLYPDDFGSESKIEDLSVQLDNFLENVRDDSRLSNLKGEAMDDVWRNTNHLPKEPPVKSKFAESKLPKFKFLDEYRSPKPQVNRMISKYIDFLSSIQEARENTFNTLQDKNMGKEALANASAKMNKKLHVMVSSAKADFNEIVKLGGNAPAVPARFDTDVKAPK